MAAFIGEVVDDGYVGYASHSQQFDSFSSAYGSSEDVVFGSRTAQGSPSSDPIFVGAGGFSPEQNGGDPILPPPTDMQPEEGFALREWRRLNAIRLEEKEKKEKETLLQIIEEAEEYKMEFYRKRDSTIENNKTSNREKEKLFVSNREKFHAEAEKNYWKAISELIPYEVPIIEKRGKKEKEKEKKPSIVVIQGPKPGKPTDLSRLRQILLKLKHNTPAHMKPKPPETPAEAKKDAKATAGAPPAGGPSAATPPKEAAAAAPAPAIVVATEASSTA